MKIILIRGAKDAGKTTTAALTYSEVFKVAKKEHLFDAENVEVNSLRFNEKGVPFDFEAILTVGGKVIVIISAGDKASLLMERITVLIILVQQELNASIDILICCGRSINKKGSVCQRLKDTYPSSELIEIWPEMTDKESDIEITKRKSVDKIIKLI